MEEDILHNCEYIFLIVFLVLFIQGEKYWRKVLKINQMAIFVFWYEYLINVAIFHIPLLVIYPIMMTGYVLAYTKYRLINRFNA